MRSTHWNAIKRLIVWTIMLFLASACSDRLPVVTSISITAAPTEDFGNLTPDEFSTLSSLEKLDDYPFYAMHYVGDYSYPSMSANLPANHDFFCSLFAALGGTGDKFYGRNFDWEFSPSLLLFTNPSDGFASVSMVDLTFIGISPAVATKLDDLPVSERTDLLTSPSLPFDGMNEYGLTVAMAAVPEEYADDTSYDPARPNIGSVGIIRQILDHARTVDEAVAIFGQYNIIFSGGPPIHYLLADPSGKAVLIEFYQGEMVQIPNQDPWHLATNHLRYIAQGDGGCWRYGTISDRLSATNGQLDFQSAIQLLSDVKQGSTQWSSLYNLTSGDINVVIAQQYETIFSFHLDVIQP
jgi:Linear amide C-N hydrolases, choloylglycine hydrolase family